MKRYMMTMMVAIFAWTGMNAMDYETAREQAYYLTDKMAYELNLNEQQYNDAYEINLDYLLSVRTEADLLDSRYLAYRNADLRHILYDWQWAAYAAIDYLFTPLRWLHGGWYFPVYRYYAHGYYFYHRPSIFWDYRGGHGRYYYGRGYYHNRRPMWNGGFRGEHRGMIGHPQPGRRYGDGMGHRNGYHIGDHRSAGQFDGRRQGNHNPMGGHNGESDYRNGSRHNYDLGSNRGSSSRPESNFRPNSGNRSQEYSRGSSPSGSSRGYSIPNINSSTRSGSTSRGSGFSGSSSRGSSFSGSTTRGSSFSGGSSRGGSMTRSSGSSMGGHESRGSRGGGRH